MLNLVILNSGEECIKDLLGNVVEFYEEFGTDAMDTYVLFDNSRVYDQDTDRYIPLVQYVIDLHLIHELPIYVNFSNLDNDFANFRNSIHDQLQFGDWVLHLDSDELVNPKFFASIYSLTELCKHDPNYTEVDLFWFPRKNIVEGITPLYLQKMGWVMDEHNRINYPDPQGRLYRFTPSIKWERPVHERIVGFRNYAKLFDDPTLEEMYTIDHIKTFDRQIRQNKFYDQIPTGGK